MRIDYIGYALALISLLYAAYLQRKNTKIKEPVYSIRSVNLISDYASVFSGLVISYQGEEVRNFTLSKVLFFNRGALTIDRSDIASRNPLRILVNKSNILNAFVFAANNPSSGFAIKVDKLGGRIDLDFEYLNQNDGAVIVVIHDGLSSRNLDVVGAMKAVKSLRSVAPGWMRVVTPPNRLNIVTGAATVFLAVVSALGLLLPISESAKGWFWGGVLYFSLLAGVSIVAAIAHLVSKSRSIAIPRGLESFDE